MLEKFRHYRERIKEGMLRDMWRQTLWIYEYARLYWKQMIFYTLLGLAGTLVSLISSLISRDMVDIITGQQAGLLARTFCLYIGFSVGNVLISQISNYFANKISISVDNAIKADIFEKMLLTDLESIQNYHTGDLLTRWSSDASNISSGVLNWIPNLVIYTVRFVSTFAVVFYHDPMFALLALIGMPVSMLMSKTLLRRMKGNNERSAAMSAKMSGFNQEAFSNIQTIKAFDLIRLYAERLRGLQREYLTMKLEFQKMSMATSILLSIVGLAVSYSCYGFGIYRVWSGAISYGTMTMFLSLSGSLTGTLNQLVSLVPTAVSLTTSAGRLMDILDMPKEDFSDADQVEQFAARNRTDGIGISFSGVSYAYHNGKQVFCGADFLARPKEIVALVGPSGEGKTTMLRLMLGLLHPQEGERTLIGETDGEKIAVDPSARRLFSYVPQGNTMFSGTIAENMRNVRPEASDEEICEVLKAACAWEFVEKLPDGIYSMVGERGGGFSEGQAQRLSIARALLRRSPILLLDEATSALDVATERRVLRNIMSTTEPSTCIVTTHRPTVLSICQKVYRIREQKCVQMQEEEIRQMMREF
ncbi:MAG: ABC transporter ATP-binding protein [Roseburia hominis]|jgi:ATP-binding cassette subfamily B protein|uniref:ABC transporter ATP-binding protein n=1 Tax=Roseburia hominis TaxID=301301 RepID=UPI002E9AE4D9|nr:ABC transporter ATP-binding protein [Roseburia hominis]